MLGTPLLSRRACWCSRGPSSPLPRAAYPRRTRTFVIAAASIVIVIVALFRWTRLAAWQPYNADMCRVDVMKRKE